MPSVYRHSPDQPQHPRDHFPCKVNGGFTEPRSPRPQLGRAGPRARACGSDLRRRGELRVGRPTAGPRAQARASLKAKGSLNGKATRKCLSFLEMSKCTRIHPAGELSRASTSPCRLRPTPDPDREGAKVSRRGVGSPASGIPGVRRPAPGRRRPRRGGPQALGSEPWRRRRLRLVAPRRGGEGEGRNSRRSPNWEPELGIRSCGRGAAAAGAARPLGVGRGWEGDR